MFDKERNGVAADGVVAMGVSPSLLRVFTLAPSLINSSSTSVRNVCEVMFYQHLVLISALA